MDKYKNFKELTHHEKQGRDYDIIMRKGDSGVAVMAPHGGCIEPGTADIADGVAGPDHSFYCFKGIKKTGNADLHITSDKFDEPIGMGIAEAADFVLAIHGCRGMEDAIFVGGNDPEFKKRLSEAIVQAGFIAREDPSSGLAGVRPANICNRGKTARGAQVEISEGLRKKMFTHLPYDSCSRKTKAFFDVVAALRKGIELYQNTMNELNQSSED